MVKGLVTACEDNDIIVVCQNLKRMVLYVDIITNHNHIMQ